jgi:hypothetical protein
MKMDNTEDKKPLTLQPYFKIDTNEYGEGFLYYNPSTVEKGRYACFMPIGKGLTLEKFKELIYASQQTEALQKEVERLNEVSTKQVANFKLLREDYESGIKTLELRNSQLEEALREIKNNIHPNDEYPYIFEVIDKVLNQPEKI